MPYWITQYYLPPDRGENPSTSVSLVVLYHFTPSRCRYSI